MNNMTSFDGMEVTLKRQGGLLPPNSEYVDVGYNLPSVSRYQLGPFQSATRTIHNVWLGRPGSVWRIMRSFLRKSVDVPQTPFAMIHTGICVSFPTGVWGMIVPRSSSNLDGLVVLPGIIDTGYTGYLYPMVHNLNPYPVVIEKGQSVAQLVLLPSIVLPLSEMNGEDRKTKRGSRGFGSTGR